MKIITKTLIAGAVVGTALWAYGVKITAYIPKQTVKQSATEWYRYWTDNDFSAPAKIQNSTQDSVYGAYLAARIAHMRQDFASAAKYYQQVLQKDADNKTVNHSIYAILASLGRIEQAAPYAQKEIDSGAEKSMAPLILAIQNFSAEQYDKARQQMDSLSDDVYTSIVGPLFDAWAYAAEKDEKNAIQSLNKLLNDPQLLSIKIFHGAMIYDYLGNTKAADELYSQLVVNYPSDVTYRILEVVTDFYVRMGRKDLAQQIAHRYHDNSVLSLLLADIDRQINNTKPNDPAVIDTPQKGLAEAMFNIGTIFRATTGGSQLAQTYIAAATFLNPEYEVSKLALANVLEDLNLLKEANRYYAQIDKNSGSYFISQMKIIENLNKLKEYDKAEKKLKVLLKDYPNNAQLLVDLGNIAADMEKYDEAIEVYQKALKVLPQVDNMAWPVYYALAVAYDKTGEKAKAEENLLKALELSNRDAGILNYLGYSWLSSGKNPDEAVQMIMEAYQKAPYEGHVIDSLGWACFKLGLYDKAMEYLEQASDMNSGNAVISDHLGDAYWFGGRKNEAVFQWKHALVLKEDSSALDKNAVKKKIADGLEKAEIISLEDETILEKLKNLTPPQD
ncbi:MAG: tetratricopeptide repeat protein [Alphaproteobacteria bacterium]|nr:tetratricopeptide repeat protein [Alphaproteobacteria bacterium]